MALLSKPGSEALVALPAHTLVGRSSACTLRVHDPLASAEHARISFAGGAWSVRDLGSRNGTFLDGARIEPGGTRALAAGARIAFGDAGAEWTLCDASPPVAMARRLADDTLITAEGGMLALPSNDAPLACVFASSDAWIAEIHGEARLAQDGEVLHLAGQPFVLHLPVAGIATQESPTAPSLNEVSLSLRVSKNEERVEVILAGRGKPLTLPARSHHYTLLTLARARARDEASTSLIEPQRGWVLVDELCRTLAIDENRLNVEVYRIRQDFAAAGFSDAPAVVERRRGSRLLRLGTARISIAPLD